MDRWPIHFCLRQPVPVSYFCTWDLQNSADYRCHNSLLRLCQTLMKKMEMVYWLICSMKWVCILARLCFKKQNKLWAIKYNLSVAIIIQMRFPWAATSRCHIQESNLRLQLKSNGHQNGYQVSVNNPWPWKWNRVQAKHCLKTPATKLNVTRNNILTHMVQSSKILLYSIQTQKKMWVPHIH